MSDLLENYEIVKRIGKTNRSNLFICKRKGQTEQKNQERYLLKEFTHSSKRKYCNAEREATILKKVSQISGIFAPSLIETDNSKFVIMEYLEGNDLERIIFSINPFLGGTIRARDIKSKLKSEKHLRVQRNLYVLSSGLDSIEALIDAGLNHNDLKPANLFYDSKKAKTYLIDFETCMTPEEVQRIYYELRSFIRTENYASPEKKRALELGNYPQIANFCEGYATGMMLAQSVMGVSHPSFVSPAFFYNNFRRIEKKSTRRIAKVVERNFKEGGILVSEVNEVIKEYLNN